jgi:hypothetical protein
VEQQVAVGYRNGAARAASQLSPFAQRVADRVGASNATTPAEVLDAVTAALAAAEQRRAQAALQSPVKTDQQLADEAFDAALFGAERTVQPAADTRTDDEVFDQLFGARS